MIEVGNFTAEQIDGVWIYKAKEPEFIIPKKKKKKVPPPFKFIDVLEKEMEKEFDNILHDVSIDIIDYISTL